MSSTVFTTGKKQTVRKDMKKGKGSWDEAENRRQWGEKKRLRRLSLSSSRGKVNRTRGPQEEGRGQATRWQRVHRVPLNLAT